VVRTFKGCLLRGAAIVIGGGLLMGTAGAVLVPEVAHAYPGGQDSAYLGCLYDGWGFPSNNPAASVRWGHEIASDIGSGLRSPVQERDFVFYASDIPTLARANVMVNCATTVFLGFGPPGNQSDNT
jgi:hypothetical protein